MAAVGGQGSAAYTSEGTRDAPYTLPVRAEEMYEHLTKHRQQVYYTAIDLAAITIPSVFPPLGYKTGFNIDESNQSINALLVNTLASKLMYMAFPMDRPVVQFEPIEHKLGQAIKQNPKLWTAIEIALNSLEQEHKSRFETTNLRTAYVGFLKQLIIGGNCLWEHLKLDFPVYHRIDTYVVKRNNQGEQLLVILKRCVMVSDLDPSLYRQVKDISPEKFADPRKEYQEQVDVYAVCKRCAEADGKTHYWEYWEEYEGELLKGTEYESDFETPPLYAAWMIPVYGQDWGRSYAEEYRGDHFIVDGHSAALNDGASIASLILLFLKSGSRTSAKQIKKAKNMSLMTGDAQDLSAFHLEKTADFQFVANNLKEVSQRLGRAYLLVSSVQRQAERVTAEEWKEMADEIDEATGGMYSELAQTIQRHIVLRAVKLHNEEDKSLPKLPPGIIRVGVMTGSEAMGRTIEAQNLERSLQGITTLVPGAMKYIDPLETAKRIFVGNNVKQDGLVLDPAAAEQKEDAMLQKKAKMTMLEKGTGPAINAMAKNAQGNPMLQKAIQGEQDPTVPPPGNQPQLPPQTGQA